MDNPDHPVAVVEAFVLRCLERTDVVYVGIDPGVGGAIAFVCGPHYRVLDMPAYKVGRVYQRKIKKEDLIPGGPKTRTIHGETSYFDLPMIVAVFKALKAVRQRVCVCVEIAQPMIKGKGSANIRTAHLVGVGFGMWPLFLQSKNYGYGREEVDPSDWKKAMGLLGKDKNASRKKAQALFPKAPLARKEDHGRAEALLLAEYARRKRGTKQAQQAQEYRH